MTFNSGQIIQEIHEEFEQMIDFVTNDAAYQATADQMERGLFTRLLKLGQQRLRLLFMLRSQHSSRDTATTAKGDCLPYHQDRKRNYLSVNVWRITSYSERQPVCNSAWPSVMAVQPGKLA